jgi:hypothetical protein
LILDFDFDQHLGSHKHVINIIMWFRDMGCYIPSPEQLERHAYCKWHNSYSHLTNDCNVFRQQVQSAINEGRLKFVENPQMKLDKDPFLANMNMVELDGKKVLV